MIEAKESLIGNINASDSLQGSLNKAIEYVSPTTQEKSITPTKEAQEVKPDEGIFALSKVIVEAVSNEIDENIKPENIKEGVSILGVEGSFVGGSGKYAPRALSFYYYTGTELDYELANVDTSNLTTTKYMFANCSNLLSVDLSKLDTSNVTNMGLMFTECRKLTEIDLSVLDTSKVQSMGNMFNYCTSLQKINFDGIDTSSLTGSCMNQMFGNCSSLKEIDMSGFNTSKADSLSSLFTGCTSLEHIDVSSFNTSNVINMSSVFNKCNSLTTLDISNFDASRVYNINNMFANCTSLANLTFMNNLGKGYTRTSSNYSQYTLNLSACPLTHDSLMDVINKLYTLGNYKQSLVLGADNLSKLTADEIAIATSKNWNVS